MAALTPEKFKVIGYTEEDANRIDRPTISYWQDAWRRLRKNPIAMGSLVVLGILLVMVIIGPHIKGYDYVSMNIAEKNQGVSSKYWFGTDADHRGYQLDSVSASYDSDHDDSWK